MLPYNSGNVLVNLRFFNRFPPDVRVRTLTGDPFVKMTPSSTVFPPHSKASSCLPNYNSSFLRSSAPTHHIFFYTGKSHPVILAVQFVSLPLLTVRVMARVNRVSVAKEHISIQSWKVVLPLFLTGQPLVINVRQ